MSEQKPFNLTEAVNAWLEMIEAHADHPFTVMHRKHRDDRPEAQAYPPNPDGGICQACHHANTARGLSEALSPSQRTAFTAGIAIGRLIEMHGVPPTVEKWEAGDA